ncbi:MAG: ABC transporter ATP-binding protein [Candidatus Asgardarchaeum sp.]
MKKEPLIKVKNLFFKYKNANDYALKNINLEIFPGEFILLIGPTGCGKTTLCRCLNGLIPHFYNGEFKGDVIIAGENTKAIPISKIATKVGMVFQNPENMLFSLNVEREIAFGLENLGFHREEIRRRVNNVIKLFGLENIRKKPPHELSGGEQQIVAIASIFVLKPSILILDEPTANLDPTTALKVINLLTELNKKFNTTIIIIEHRLEMIIPIVSRVIVMNDGQIVFDGTTEDVLKTTILESLGIQTPKASLLIKQLLSKYPNLKLLQIPKTVDEAVKILEELL